MSLQIPWCRVGIVALALTVCSFRAVAATDASPTLKDGDNAGLSLPACQDSVPGTLRAEWIPARPDDAPTGSEFAARTKGWSGRARQQEALAELRRGNLPEFLRTLHPVRLQHRSRDGQIHEATVWVTPDYLSIGSDTDYLRLPLTRPTAVTIASGLGFVLPTRKIVDAVYSQAQVRLPPMPLPPGRMMRSSEYYVKHNAMIEEALAGRAPGDLLAGHKKDVVLTNRLLGKERIAIYGWHKDAKHPIQGLSTVHGARYADYSHGVRLVYSVVCLDGRASSIYDVLEDEALAPILTYEGWIERFRRLMRW